MSLPGNAELPRFAAATSTAPDTDLAASDVYRQACEQLSSEADLAIVFASPHHSARMTVLAHAIADKTKAKCLLGCTGEGIIGVGQEIENQPAVSLWLARLPGATVRALHLQFAQTPEGGTFVGWPDDMPAQWPAGSALLLLGEPYTFPADALIRRLNDDQSGVSVIGGMASGGHGLGANRLILGRTVYQEGAVGVLIHGGVEIRSVVSQGCRPIGRHFVVTKARDNVILELSGRPGVVQLEELYDSLPATDQRLVQRGLHVGVVINEYREHFGRGDFLVRNCLGIDRATGAVVIGDAVRVGQTVQFHVRDAQTADEDFRELLAGSRDVKPVPLGALLFSCNGRGTRLFDQPHHDAAALAELLGQIPVAGFFAQGEIGPIGGKSFLHGFTASVALFAADVG